MEPQETPQATNEAIAEDTSITENPKAVTPTITNPAPAQSATNPAVDDTLQSSYDFLKEIKQIWETYFGEGKKANLTLLITIVATIPVLIATSVLLEFLNKLPLLPSVFELVGFGYSAWFIYRYLLLANTRKELVDTIKGWKSKVFG